ncbi:hypothetical protein [Pelagibius sp. Alg239-R121]|uniref:hypothetical protein n=1 Tax=Pelagibius sp. Alg239-R121 TaxID=2993448 RepID=UPI0024A632F4|nr:hypothetical protein [Pelagibius sp. Alg239-R121]
MRTAAMQAPQVPREWSWGVERLLSQPEPLPLSDGRWKQAQEDAADFLQTWGEQAFLLGWGVLPLFGVSPDAPEPRVDQAGLCWLLRGDRVVALTEHAAIIEIRNGARQSFPSRVRPGQIPLWTLGFVVKRQQQEAQ